MPAFSLPSLLLLAVAPALVEGSTAGAQSPAPEARVDSLFVEFTRGVSPGAAVAVVRDGKVLLTRGYGYANLEDRVPITPTTVFDVASVSKQFTGLAVAMLVEEGRIRLDDDIRKYIPELHAHPRPITVRHLVHHTSGIRDWPSSLGVAGWRFDDVISFDQILTFAYGQRTLNFIPGAEYTYSNTGYNLLAEMVSRVTGRTFRQWTDEHIFGPLGMTKSRFRDDHAEVIPDRALGYTRAPGGGVGFRGVTNNLTALGSSSLFTTVEDMARWLINFDEGRVGGRAAISMMRARGVLSDGSAIPYAFGISHSPHRGLAALTHSGSWAGFTSYLMHFPEQRFGVVVLANTPANPARLAAAVADIYLSPNAPIAAPTTPAGAARSPEVPRAVLDEYAGTYKLGPGWYLRVRRDGDALRVQATREQEQPATAVDEREFWVQAYGSTITFARDSAGRMSHALYRGRNAPRMPTSAPAAADLATLVGDYESAELRAAYRVELRDGRLVMLHPRHGTIALTQAWGDDFVTSSQFLAAVQFERDAGGRGSALVVHAGERSRAIRFIRR